jgi:hypothetical protein
MKQSAVIWAPETEIPKSSGVHVVKQQSGARDLSRSPQRRVRAVVGLSNPPNSRQAMGKIYRRFNHIPRMCNIDHLSVAGCNII